MPLAQIKGISGNLTIEQKQEIIRKVTEAIVSVEGEGLRLVTWVLIQDVNSGEWGVAGKPVTTEDLRKISVQGG
jgi:4-oxalocrotonate tautomerase